MCWHTTHYHDDLGGTEEDNRKVVFFFLPTRSTPPSVMVGSNYNKKRETISCLSLSGYQDSNLGPSGPKPDALTGLRYIPLLYCECKGKANFLICKLFLKILSFFLFYPCFYHHFEHIEVKYSPFSVQ